MIRKAFQKFKEDVFAKALYDIVKFIALAILLAVVYYFVPEDTSFTDVMNKKLTFSLFQFILIIVFTIAIALFIYFLFNRKRFALIKRDLLTDELTGIPKGRALTQDLKTLIQWSKSEQKLFSIVLMDIDDFKKLNDKHSPKVADDILVKFGTLLASDRRNTDTFYRQHLKGDEFIIIAKETILENAVVAAERKRTNIAATGIEVDGFDQPFFITVCCGVVQFNPLTDDQNTILERAAKAMRKAKENPGKNSTVRLV